MLTTRTSMVSESLEAFHLFSFLPTEIRLKIWFYSITPRIVILPRVNSNSITSPTSIPAILQTSREARYEALRVYRLAFATTHSLATVYIANGLDTVYIHRYRQMGYDETLRDFKSYLLNPNDLDGITSLALDYVDTRDKRPWEAYDKAVLIRSFPDLTTVELVLAHADRSKRFADIELISPLDHLMGQGIGITEAENGVRRREGEFRNSWAVEEGIAREVADSDCKPFDRWVLPELKVVGKRCLAGDKYLRLL